MFSQLHILHTVQTTKYIPLVVYCVGKLTSIPDPGVPSGGTIYTFVYSGIMTHCGLLLLFGVPRALVHVHLFPGRKKPVGYMVAE